MFTGIIEEVGEVVAAGRTGAFATLTVRADEFLIGTSIGSSLAVNGVCLTARQVSPGLFSADLSDETLRRTALGSLEAGDLVNLERAMRADARFDGHIVQGHVDGIGTVRQFDRTGSNWMLQIDIDPQGQRYIVEKGSIAIDGISLTVAGLSDTGVRIAIIPHTLEKTNLRKTEAGRRVNVEFDVIAKYVERMLGPHRPEGYTS